MPRKSGKKAGTPKTRRSIVRKKKIKVQKQSVMKMIATMEASRQNVTSSNGPTSTTAAATAAPPPPTPDDQQMAATSAEEEFLQTGRTGRRNALPDILDSNKASTSSSDLPSRLEGLTTEESNEAAAQAPPAAHS